jgi:hypothetical protein
MPNHFQVLLEVPKRPDLANGPSDQERVEPRCQAECPYGAETLAQQLVALLNVSRVTEAEALRGGFSHTCGGRIGSNQRPQM